MRDALGKKYRWLLSTNFRIPIRCKRRSCSFSRPRLRTSSLRKLQTGARSAFVLAHCLSSAIPSSRSTGSAARTSKSITEVRKLIGSATGDVLPLTSNFRSVAALCEWTNGVFLKQFPAVPTLQSPQYTRLEPVERKPTGSAGLFTLSIPATVEKNAISTF